MTRFLVATDSVHTTAAACDYLVDRTTADDAVTALAVSVPGSDPRDGEDALNVATVRLGAAATVETETREGTPAEEILAAADEVGADEIVIGPRRGVPGADEALGGTAATVLERAAIPVVVVPFAGPT